MLILNIDHVNSCIECPLQLRFKDGEVDDWYMHRCVVTHGVIRYPERPDDCPIVAQPTGDVLRRFETLLGLRDDPGEGEKDEIH